MKRSLLLFCILIVLRSSAQSWQTVGTPGFSPMLSEVTGMAISSTGVPYVAFVDNSYAYSGGLSVMKYTDSAWDYVGMADFGGSSSPYNMSFIIGKNDTPFVLFPDASSNSKLLAMKYNNYYWEYIDTGHLSVGTVYYNSMAVDKNGTLYVAFCDQGHGGGVTVMQYNGSQFQVLGAPNISGSSTLGISIAVDTGGVPYVAFLDACCGSDKVSVMKYVSGIWVVVGIRQFSASVAHYISLAFDGNDIPYVAYEDLGNSGKATVMTFDGSSWSPVGTAGFSAGTSTYVSLAIDGSNNIYASYADAAISNKAVVMTYNSTGWTEVGGTACSDSVAKFNALAIDPSGASYVAYLDYAQGSKATVKRYGYPAGVKNIAPQSMVNIYPNPAHDVLYIETNNVVQGGESITICNTIGQVMNVPITTNGTKDIVDVSHLPPGLYNVRYNNGSVQKTVMFVKE